MQAASLLDGFSFDLFPPFKNGLTAPEVDVSRRQVVQALVVSTVVVQLDNITPTGPRNGKFFIPGIRGLAVWCSFMKRRRGAAQACCAAPSRARRAHAV